MGLFSFVGKAIGSVLGDITGTNAQAKAAGKASDAQVKLGYDSLAEQRRQFDETQGNLQPYVDAGKLALGGQEGLLGLNGAGPQQAAIDALRASPLFQSLFQQGQDTILNNASATGGLRGGNLQGSLANFGRDTLAQVIQQQLANLGGLSAQGGATGGTLGGLGASNANSISSILSQIGADKAGGILAKGNAQANGISSGINLAKQIVGLF